MSEQQHLEFDISLRFTVCTKLDKKQLLPYIYGYLEGMPNCFVVTKDFILNNIKLCDCEAYADKIEECEAEECEDENSQD